MLIGSFISKGISICSSVILARILVADDYGAMVFAGVFVGLVTQLGGMGYELYYLQYKGSHKEREKVLEQVFNLRLVTNFFMFLILGSIGISLLLFTENKISGGILAMMSVSLMLEGFNSPHEALLKDELQFNKITRGNILKELFSTFGKVAAAILGFGGYSFGVGPVIGSLVRMIYYRTIKPFSHEFFLWDKGVVKKIFGFGKHVMLGSIGMYIVQQIDRILLSLFFPQSTVGRYGFAWGNASMPFNYIIAPQSQLTSTYIAKSNDQGFNLFVKLNLVTRLVSLVYFPITILGVFYSYEIISIVFTNKWVSTSTIVSILLVYYYALTFCSSFSFLLTGMGYPNIVSKLTLFKAITLTSSLLLVNLIFPPNVILYVCVFVVFSLIFDILKVFLGISKLNVKFFAALNIMKYEILNLLILIFSIIYWSIFGENISRIWFVLILSISYTLSYFFFDKKRTFRSISLIIPNKTRSNLPV